MKRLIERTATRAFVALSAAALRIRLALASARRAVGQDAETRLWAALIALLWAIATINGLRAAGLLG